MVLGQRLFQILMRTLMTANQMRRTTAYAPVPCPLPERLDASRWSSLQPFSLPQIEPCGGFSETDLPFPF